MILNHMLISPGICNQFSINLEFLILISNKYIFYVDFLIELE